ncbi:GNAT family N-acetyltransferase [marine bacterium AO1-C]|nr:GNAT family N-acetyltransferase [marine bacterium AO1-C]
MDDVVLPHDSENDTQLLITQAAPADYEQIWEIIEPIIRKGDTYVFDPGLTKEAMKAVWMSPKHRVYVARFKDEIVGTYFIKDNQSGLGAHVANAGYMVHPERRGLSIGRKMAEHSLEEARRVGYKAMQFNMVISTNIHAIRLWKKLGFQQVGILPKVFNHQEEGLVDALVMHRFL